MTSPQRAALAASIGAREADLPDFAVEITEADSASRLDAVAQWIEDARYRSSRVLGVPEHEMPARFAVGPIVDEDENALIRTRQLILREKLAKAQQDIKSQTAPSTMPVPPLVAIGDAAVGESVGCFFDNPDFGVASYENAPAREVALGRKCTYLGGIVAIASLTAGMRGAIPARWAVSGFALSAAPIGYGLVTEGMGHLHALRNAWAGDKVDISEFARFAQEIGAGRAEPGLAWIHARQRKSELDLILSVREGEPATFMAVVTDR